MSTTAPRPDLAAFVAGLPKAELHVHHVGSASPAIVAELAARHEGSSPVPADPERLADYFTFTDFAHFVEVYLSVVDLIRTPEDVHALTLGVGRDMAAQRIRYAELTLSPYTSIIRGIDAADFTGAVEDARRTIEAEGGPVLRWVVDIPGESGLDAAEVTLDYALHRAPETLVAFGLGGPEIGVPRPQFQPHFDAARAAGLHSVPHSGESTGPETVWDAVRLLGAERVGHGITSAQDPALLAHLAEHGIALEICPTSNVRTRSVPSLEEHPLPVIAAAGVPFSIASDDPPMFGTDLGHEYLVAADLLGLDETGVADLARDAVRQSFLDDAGKASLLAEIDAYAGSGEA
ncbi:adenosine deaminase [Lapillicoccus jejuensis]|uniref:Aminodeoxyfutalosine deaminase n=1 Tax=Lapillicoccus jejuensis TaxID=402171 RepID=A0A542E0S5_9MICO|nr:adenosine deaminase [Lapillicoccus jejuensis]TQJ08879.1 aminodeoxyfutalosine deaminase [Lapillicoccus jejuensis]